MFVALLYLPKPWDLIRNSHEMDPLLVSTGYSKHVTIIFCFSLYASSKLFLELRQLPRKTVVCKWK